MSVSIPVLRPKLPEAYQIAPYIKGIDEARWYSNFGPLELRLRERLAGFQNWDAENLALFSTGTAALSIALKALLGDASTGNCAMPAWTHIGTATAATNIGMSPYFVDCEDATWGMSVEALAKLAAKIKISAAIVVAPFGARIDYQGWCSFAAETGIAVVIDAAAGFDQFIGQTGPVTTGLVPVMVSLHATKAFGIGEGGLLISSDIELIRRTRAMSNFGIDGDLPIVHAFGNYKLNEYNAAVGLAFADFWRERRAELARLSSIYLRLTSGRDIEFHPGFGGEFACSTCMMSVKGMTSADLEHAAFKYGIGTRRWWREGLHRIPAFDRYSRTEMSVTDGLSERFIGVPFFPGMDTADIEYVIESLSC